MVEYGMVKRHFAWTWLIACLALAAVLRLLYLSEISRGPDFDAPVVDAGFHDYWARGLAFGQWRLPPSVDDPSIGATPYFRPPGYPYFLALTYILGRGSYYAPRVANMLMGLAGVILAWLIAWRWFGHGTAALAALFMAAYWHFIFFEGELLEPPLLIPLALLVVLLGGLWADKPRKREAFGGGLALGIFALARPNILLFLPLFLLWLWWAGRKRFEGKIIRSSILAAVIGVALAIAPAALRNWVVGDDRILISSNGGINFYLGNNPEADGRIMGSAPGFGVFLTCFDYPSIVRRVERSVGKPLKHSQVSAFFSRKALDYIASHPARAADLLRRKILLFWGPLEVGHNKEDEIQRSHSGLLSVLPGGFPWFAGSAAGTLIFFFLTGRGLGRNGTARPSAHNESRRRMVALCLAFIGGYFASFLPYTVAGRYRTPIVPFLMILSAAGIDLFRRLVIERRFHLAASWLSLSGVMVVIAFLNLSGYVPDHPRWHYDLGLAWGRRERVVEAVRELAEAVRLDEGYAEAHAALGYGLAIMGRGREAEREWRRAISANPGYPPVYAYMGRYFLSIDRPEDAVAALKTAVSLDPDQETWRRDMDRAISALRKVPTAPP